jgi:hypothetical protein
MRRFDGGAFDGGALIEALWLRRFDKGAGAISQFAVVRAEPSERSGESAVVKKRSGQSAVVNAQSPKRRDQSAVVKAQ